MSAPDTEFRFAEFRFDADSGRITGTVMRYGDVATLGGKYRESFQSGALAYQDVIVNLQHDRARPVARTGAGLALTQTPVALSASITLPDTSYAREARELVTARILRGFSVEFRALTEEWIGTHRTIHEAELLGIGLVDRPAYPDSVLAERMELRYRERLPPAYRHRRYWV